MDFDEGRRTGGHAVSKPHRLGQVGAVQTPSQVPGCRDMRVSATGTVTFWEASLPPESTVA